MNSVQEKELLDFLSSVGFSGNDFEDRLQQKLKLGLPGFTVQHEIPFGEEKMLFKLYLKKDHQFNAYRLDKYDATYRRPIDVPHELINGIDTSHLEERMKAIDWNIYFNNPDNFSPFKLDEIKAVTSDLWQITAIDSHINGPLIVDLLQLKYWPEHMWDGAAADLRPQYESTHTFYHGESGILNANIAYNDLSGRMSELYELLTSLNMDTLISGDLYNDIQRELSANPSGFNLRYSRNEREGFFEFIIPVTEIDKTYTVDTYEATLIPYPPIEHGVYNGIDTKQLEEMMQAIDWHNDSELFIFHPESEPEFTSKVGDVQEMMFRLSQDLVGADIADQLQLKYWSDATFFDSTLQQSAWDHLDTLPKRTLTLPAEIEPQAALNLLAGRAVWQDGSVQHWIRYDPESKAEKTHIRPVEGFHAEDIKSLLKSLPIESPNAELVRLTLLRGDLVPVKLSNGKSLLLEANPEQQTINLYTKDLQPIYTNLHFDPAWKPPVNEAQSEQQNARNHIRSAQTFQRKKPDHNDQKNKGNRL